MNKFLVFITLFVFYVSYSFWVYTKGTDKASSMTKQQQEGKELWQKYNCQSCHQIFGLGGYLGPELTTVISDKNRGEVFAKAFLENGGSRMPNFHFNAAETDALIDYLRYIDANAFSYKPKHL